MTDSSTAIAVAPLIVDLAPYALALLPVAIGWLAAELRAHRIANLSQDALDKINMLAKAEAGSMIAASETNLAGEAIPVGSLIIAQAAKRIIDAAPTILADAGITPASVATMVAGHLGAMQAAQSPLLVAGSAIVAPAAPAPAP